MSPFFSRRDKTEIKAEGTSITISDGLVPPVPPPDPTHPSKSTWFKFISALLVASFVCLSFGKERCVVNPESFSYFEKRARSRRMDRIPRLSIVLHSSNSTIHYSMLIINYFSQAMLNRRCSTKCRASRTALVSRQQTAQMFLHGWRNILFRAGEDVQRQAVLHVLLTPLYRCVQSDGQ